MGTVVTIDLYCERAVERGELYVRVARARSVLQRADAVFSTWKEHSPVSRLRRGEITLAEAPAEVAQVLEGCEAARSASLGWFDPWAMPAGADPTGYVKGWAAQRALGALAMAGVSGAIINAAGDIAAFGSPGAGRRFRVGIVDPSDRRELACAVELTGAVATSGTYERGAHLIDPWSGKPAARVASATVTGPDLGLADALATALAVAARGPRFPGADSGLRGLCHRPRRLVAVERELPIRADRNPKKDLTRRCLDRPQACRGKDSFRSSSGFCCAIRWGPSPRGREPQRSRVPVPTRARGRADRATAANGLGLGGRLVVGRAELYRHPPSLVVEHRDQFQPGAEGVEVLAQGRDAHVVGVLELGDGALGHVQTAGQLRLAERFGVAELVQAYLLQRLGPLSRQPLAGTGPLLLHAARRTWSGPSDQTLTARSVSARTLSISHVEFKV